MPASSTWALNCSWRPVDMTGNYAISLTTGEDLEWSATWRDDDASPINLTGCTAAFVIDNSQGTLSSDPVTLGGAAGTLAVAIPADDLAATLAGKGGGIRYRVMITNPSGDVMCQIGRASCRERV